VDELLNLKPPAVKVFDTLVVHIESVALVQHLVEVMTRDA
jgi:hypothetical protein